jgi:hypothetical protein
VIQARIPGYGDDNMIYWLEDCLLDSDGNDCGGWAFANEEQEPPQCWTDGVCWDVNEDGKPSVKPTHWMSSSAELSDSQ